MRKAATIDNWNPCVFVMAIEGATRESLTYTLAARRAR